MTHKWVQERSVNRVTDCPGNFAKLKEEGKKLNLQDTCTTYSLGEKWLPSKFSQGEIGAVAVTATCRRCMQRLIDKKYQSYVISPAAGVPSFHARDP